MSVNDGVLLVAFAASQPFNRRRADDPAKRELVQDALRSLTGEPLRLRYDTYDDDSVGVSEVPAPPPSEEDVVSHLMSAFDAEEIVPDIDTDTDQPQPPEVG
jgi:hypothetical protein